MSTDLFETPAADAEPAVFADRIMAATLGGMDLVAIHLGRSLGWYQALVDDGPLTSVDLAARTGTQERYAREWLEQQAVGGWLLVEDEAPDATQRRYRVAPGAVPVLTDPDSPLHVAPVAGFVIAACRRIDDLAAASRTGGGVSWSQFGDDARTAQAALNRPLFLDELPRQIVPTIAELHARLQGAAVSRTSAPARAGRRSAWRPRSRRRRSRGSTSTSRPWRREQARRRPWARRPRHVLGRRRRPAAREPRAARSTS